MDPLDAVDVHIWVLKAVKLNPGYGVERLLSRIQDRFPNHAKNWDRNSLQNWLSRMGAQENHDYFDQLEQKGSKGASFQDPIDADGDGFVTQEEIIKYVRIHNPEWGVKAEDDVSKLKSNKHKIAWYLADHFDLTGDLDDYYSKSGTIKIRYWYDLISSRKMGLSEYATNSRERMAETIFKENNLEWVKEEYIAKSGGGVKVKAYLVLCDHFAIEKMPKGLWGALDSEEDDEIIIPVQGRISPDLQSQEETIGGLIEQFVENRIFVPDFQRQFTWAVKKQRLLIDSILTGIPLPSILLIREEGGDWWLVDGQQRLTTLRNFIQPIRNSDSFDLGILSYPNGQYSNLKFGNLPDEIQKRIKETKIPVTRIRGLENNKRAVYQLFHRYNTGGETLNAAEIRHAVFHENPYHKKLFRLAGENQDKDEFRSDTKKVRDALGAKYSNNASKYKWYQRLSRFFGYCYSNSSGSTTETVYNFFEERDITGNKYNPRVRDLGDIFIETANLCEDLYGKEYKFKKLKKDAEKGSFGDIPYTMQMVSARFLIDNHPDQIDKIRKVKSKVIEEWKEYYMKEIYEQRQNSSNIWRWQNEWYAILEKIAVELGESDYEIMLATAEDLYKEGGQGAVRAFLDTLGQKDYWEKLHEECYKRGWC